MAGLRVAVLGAGDMAGHHLRAWQALGHEVVSVTDLDAPRAQELARREGVQRVYRDYRDAVAEEGVDVVSVCLPLALHAPATIAAARHGKHVFCEKPLARNMTEADRMEAAVSDAGVRFGIGFQRNLAEGVGMLRRGVAEGRFGHPVLYSSDLLQQVRPKPGMHERSGNGGPLTDAGCHYYLLWQTVFRSKPKTVHAQGRIAATERPELAHVGALAIDTAVVSIDYESGDIGTLTVSWGLPAGFKMRSRPERIIGPRGGAEGSTETGLTFYDGEGVSEVPIKDRDLWEVELEIFAEKLRGGSTRPAGFVEGRQMIAVTEAVHRSIDTGQPEQVSW